MTTSTTARVPADDFADLDWSKGHPPMLPDFAWKTSTREDYHFALNCLPPAATRRDMFLVGEASDHRGEGCVPRFRVHREIAGVYSVGSRPITVAELEILAALPPAA